MSARLQGTRDELWSIFRRAINAQYGETAADSMDRDYAADLLDEWFEVHDRAVLEHDRLVEVAIAKLDEKQHRREQIARRHNRGASE